jgi:opacity protein-like surface antigen
VVAARVAIAEAFMSDTHALFHAEAREQVRRGGREPLVCNDGATVATTTWTVMMLVGLLMTMAGVASGQSQTPMDWTHGAVASGFVGAGTASDAGPAVGVGLGWEMTRRVSLDGRGRWFDGGSSSEGAFNVDLVSRVSLVRTMRAMPYVAAGIGMYRVVFDQASSDVPSFYRDRMDTGAAAGTRQTFRDVSWTAGGGIDVFLNPHIAIRPEASVLLVTTSGDARAMAVWGVHVVYHFEPHIMQP